MTFGSTFGRTFSPTFQPKSTAVAAASSWWLSGGIAAENATLVFQAKGAASQEDTYKNLVTGDVLLNSSVCVSWSSANGWYNDASAGNYNLSNEYCGFAGLANTSTSWIIKIASPVIDGAIHSPFRIRFSAGNTLMRVLATTGYVSFWNQTSYASSVQAATGVYACGGRTCYIDGDAVGTVAAATYGAVSSMKMGINTENDGGNDFNGYIHAMAFYKTGITEAQVAAVGAAISAL
jgi:hypothetical protein